MVGVVVPAWVTVTTAVTVLAALYAASFLVCVAIRLTFGFELSWMESGMQAMTARLDAHQSMYAAPSPSYVPFIYPPLYYIVAHALGRAAPALAGPMAMRLLSSLSVVATLLVLWNVLGRRAASLRMRLLLSRGLSVVLRPLRVLARHQPRRQLVRAAGFSARSRC